MYPSHLQGSRRTKAFEDGTDTLSQNVSKALPLNSALYPRRAQISDLVLVEKYQKSLTVRTEMWFNGKNKSLNVEIKHSNILVQRMPLQYRITKQYCF
jgi:hypothetical protein